MNTVMWVIIGILVLLLIGGVIYVLVKDDSGAEAVALAAADAEPRVWHVAGERGGADSVNILFLGDGFVTDLQLEAYRSAVYQLATGLVSRPPFCHYTDRLDFYRIDVRDESDQFPDSACASGCSELKPLDAGNLLASAPTADEVAAGADIVDLDLGATRCWSSSSAGSACHVFWADAPAREAAFQLATRLPSHTDIEVVVVVVNAQEKAGAGLYDVSVSVDRMVFVAVDLEPGEIATESQVSTQAHLLFAHEMGHALGLFDEYILNSSSLDPPEAGRNVWVPEVPASAATVFASVVGGRGTDNPSWLEALPPGCYATSMVPCCGGTSDVTDCAACSGVSAIDCHVVPSICQDPYPFCYYPYVGPCEQQASCTMEGLTPVKHCAPAVCDKTAGAWEGAAYRRTGFYRAERTCRMRELRDEIGFCDACAIYLRDKIFKDSGVSSYEEILEDCPTTTETEEPGIGMP